MFEQAALEVPVPDDIMPLNPEHEIVKKYLESGSWKKADIKTMIGQCMVKKVLRFHIMHCSVLENRAHEIVKQYLESGGWVKVGVHSNTGKRAVLEVLRFHLTHCLNILGPNKKVNQRVLWTCPVCSKEMMLTTTQAKRRKYCSFQCFKSIPRRRKPRSEKRSFRISPEWRRARKKCISKFGHVCPVSFKREPIEVHHIDFDWLNNEPENLIPLWAPLHRLITARGEVSSFYETLDRTILLSITRAWR